MNGVAQFAQILSTLVFFPLLVSSFGTGNYGVYVIALSVAGMARMFDFGIAASTVRMVANRMSVGDDAGFARVVSSSAVLLGLVGLGVGAVIVALGTVAGRIFNVTPEQAQLLTTLLYIAAAMEVWYWPTSIAAHVLNGLERHDLAARTSVLSTIANVGTIGIVLYTGAGPVRLMLLGAVVMVIASLANLITLRMLLASQRLVCLPGRAECREILSTGAPVFVNGVAQYFNREQVDRLVIGIAIGPSAVVLYEVAAKLSMLIGMVAVLPTSAVLPVVSRAVAEGGRSALRGLFLKGGRYITIAIAPLVIILAVLAAPFIDAWFGGEFAGSVPIAVLLILGQLLYPPLLIGDPILTGTGRLGAWVPMSILIALVNVGVSIALVGRLGPVGVALGTLIASLVELPLYSRLLLRETDVPLGLWVRTAWVGYLPLPVAGVVAACVSAVTVSLGLLGVAVAGACALAAYWLCVWLLVFSAAERERFFERLRRLLAARSGGGT